MLLDVGEHRARELQELVERLACVLVEERTVLLGETVALTLDRRGRALDLLACLQRSQIAADRRVGDARVVEPAPVVVRETVARRHVEPRILRLLELGEPGASGVGLPELILDLGRRPLLAECCVDPCLERQPSQPAQLGVGPEQKDVDAGDHLRDVLVRDVGKLRLAELRERRVRAVAEQQELEVVLPHQVAHPDRPAVGIEDLVERGVAIVAERHLVRLVLGKVRHLQGIEVGDQGFHLRPPLRVELVPVLEVVAGAFLEEPSALSDLRGIGHRIAGDVDVAVDAAVVDPHRRRHGEHAVLPRADCLIRRVDADHVEGRHRHREVHRVPEPEAVLVRLAPLLIEQRVVRVHLLPAFAAGGRLDRVRTGKCRRRRRCQRFFLRFLFAVPQQFLTSQAG